MATISFNDMTPLQELHTLLTTYAAKEKPTSYLEIGVREGNSLLALLDGWKPQRLCLCDHWGPYAEWPTRTGHEHIAALLAAHNIDAQVTWLDGDSRVLVPNLKETFDFITVDGNHARHPAADDLKAAWPLLNKNGLLFFDDIFHPAHLYLYDVVLEFLHCHRDDARLERLEKNPPLNLGCSIIRKIK
jgi:predicted O-methyltransferase YrrM